MKNKLLVVTYFLLVSVILLLLSNSGYATDKKIEEIRKAIKEKGASWIAGENWVTKLSDEDRKRLCGAKLEAPADAAAKLITLSAAENLPPVFDWRDNGGNWVTPVRDQGQCGSCWAFSAVGQVELWWMIKNANRDTMLDLSEQFVLSCSDGTCDGWWTAYALDFIRDTGVPLESCFGYHASDAIPCSSACSNWEEQAVTIPGWGYVTLQDDIIQNIKNAVYRHPVSAGFTVYEDFQSYHSGVYEHVYGDEDGGHAIVIVGWNDYEQSWICKNSWGPTWGEKGYFRIRWGQCEMGSFIPFVWDNITVNNPVLANPEQLNFNLTIGDSAGDTFTLTNYGQDTVEYSVVGNDVPRWLDIFNGVGKIDPGSAVTVGVGIQTRTISPGNYSKVLTLRSNDRTIFSLNIVVNLQLKAPDYDQAVSNILIPGEGVAILSTIDVGAEVKNCGLNATSEFFASCEIYDNNQRIYADTTRVNSIAVNKTTTVNFEPFQAVKTGEYEFVVTIFDLASDYNNYNNQYRSVLLVNNLIDGFETDTGNWLFEGGWGITEKLTRHAGHYAVHVNNGAAPYLNNMNATMTYVKGFDLRSLDKATLAYWTRYLINPDGDICYVEISGDYQNWVKMDSLNCVGPRSWTQRKIGLTDMLHQGYDMIWVRFRFVSNEENADFGIFIDDIEIYVDEATGVDAIHLDSELPQQYWLSQNYPNPFNSETRFNYYLPEAEEISIIIYNTTGQVVRKLWQANQIQGYHSIEWNGLDDFGYPVSTGVYFIRLMNKKNFTMTRKLVFMK